MMEKLKAQRAEVTRKAGIHNRKLKELREQADSLEQRILSLTRHENLAPFVGRVVTLTQGKTDKTLSAGPIILRTIKRSRVLVDVNGKEWLVPIEWIQESSPGGFYMYL